MILIEKDEGDNDAQSLFKKKKFHLGLNHGQIGPSNAVAITAIIKILLTSL